MGYRYYKSKDGEKIIDIDEIFNLEEIYKLLPYSSTFLVRVEDVLCLNDCINL
ncbi:hypothetical protein [Campylobacter blaseri]|uniref:hypothetical protein n=1 Tax=Campylobacter blaseri TaxID=2042961 RepID=UPI0012FFE0F1|nr:hypothetical protein [Campylobacter blaseri]